MTLIYPTLLFSANNTESFSWFDIKSRKNFSHKKRKKKTIINSTYNDTFKIILNLNSRQKQLLILGLMIVFVFSTLLIILLR